MRAVRIPRDSSPATHLLRVSPPNNAQVFAAALVHVLANRILGHGHDDANHHERRDERRAARRDERQGLARRREHADGAPDVQERLEHEHDGDRTREHGAEVVTRSTGDAHARPQQHEERCDHDKRTDEAELLADDRIDEVGLRFGQVQVLLTRVSQTHAENAAFGDRIVRMHELVALAVTVFAIVPRVQEQEAVATVTRQHDGEQAERDERADDDEDGADGHFAEPHDGEDADRDDGGGTQVGLRAVQESRGDDDGYDEHDDELTHV